MIEFGISHYNLEQMVRFSKLLGKSIDEFIIGSIKVHLCEWSYDKDIFINGRGLNIGESDIDLIINLSEEDVDDLWEFTDYHDESMYDVIQGMIDNTLHFLELNWNGHFNEEDTLLSDKEKVKELVKTHGGEEGKCWNNNFSWVKKNLVKTTPCSVYYY